MGFFGTSAKVSTGARLRPSDDLIHKLGCRACPLNKARHLQSPKMEASGSEQPLIYILGESPGEIEDQEGIQFVGPSGEFVRPKIPNRLRKWVRYNNVLNCVPYDTLVSSPGSIRRIFRREFTGILITPITRSGRVFSATENHPVLTARGWIAANKLVKGDHLVCSTVSGWEVVPAGPYKYDCPTRIGEIFDALSEAAVSERIVGSSVDFHGDGRDGQVDVISTCSELGDSCDAPSSQEFLEKVLAAASCRFGVEPHTCDSFSPATYLDPRPGEVSSNCSVVVAEHACELFNTFAGRVCFDEVVDIHAEPFEGPVFNLETITGWYIADNVIIHNCHPQFNRDPEKIEIEACRPRVEQDIERTKPAAIFGLGGFALMWADKPSGIELWRGRRFPIQVGSHRCWFYPMLHPAFILHTKTNSWKSDNEIAFQFDIKRAIAEVEAGLPEPVIHTAKFARENITTIKGSASGDLGYILEFLEYAGSCEVVGVDDETQGLRPYRPDSQILTRAVSAPDETVAFAWKHREAGWSPDDMVKLEKAWVKFLKSPAKKAVHNAAFEIEWDCFFYGRNLAWALWECTQTQAYVLDERVGEHKPGALALEFISLQHFGINIKKLTPGLDKTNMKNEPLSVLLPYNGIDAKYHRLNYEVQEQRLKDEGLVDVYQEKLRQVPTVVLTQIKGIPTDSKETIKLEREYGGKLAAVTAKIQALPEAKEFRRLTGYQFNPGSAPDVVILLKDILKTREGQEGTGWSTREPVLSKIDSPLAKGVLEYRGIQKLKSTYIDPYMPGSPFLYPGDILHPSFSTTNTETGRLACEQPNVQNQPVRNAEGKKVRKQITAALMASVDAGQIDARMIACGSRDKNYCKALWEDYDIHAEWARRLALRHPDFIGGKKNLSDPAIMRKFRGDQAKNTWVFALFYGASLRSTAARFRVEEQVLQPLYDEFWKQFSDVKAWQEKLIAQFEETGYVQMLGGQRRRAPLVPGQIVNSPVQNATNRIVMHGMNRLSETGIWELQPNMQIHDDLTYCFESYRDYEDNIDRIADTMLDCREFDWICVPLVVEIKDGPNWADLKEVCTLSSYKRLGWPVRPKEFM